MIEPWLGAMTQLPYTGWQPTPKASLEGLTNEQRFRVAKSSLLRPGARQAGGALRELGARVSARGKSHASTRFRVGHVHDARCACTGACGPKGPIEEGAFVSADTDREQDHRGCDVVAQHTKKRAKFPEQEIQKLTIFQRLAVDLLYTIIGFCSAGFTQFTRFRNTWHHCCSSSGDQLHPMESSCERNSLFYPSSSSRCRSATPIQLYSEWASGQGPGQMLYRLHRTVI